MFFIRFASMKLLYIYYQKLNMKSYTGFKYKYYYIPVVTTLNLILYKGDIKQNISKLIKSWLPTVTLIIALLFVIYSSFKVGFNMNQKRIEFTKIVLEKTFSDLNEAKEDQFYAELSLSSLFDSRDYKNYLIYKESNLSVPDKVSEDHMDIMIDKAEEFDIPYSIMFRVIARESRFNWFNKHGKVLTSGAGAMGYMQIIPGTFNSFYKKLELEGGHTPENNITVGAYYLNKLYKMYNDSVSDRHELQNWKLPLAAYNAGPGNIKNHQIPDFTETKNYVKNILDLNKKF